MFSILGTGKTSSARVIANQAVSHWPTTHFYSYSFYICIATHGGCNNAYEQFN